MNDRKLPGLQVALDEAAMRPLLAAALRHRLNREENFLTPVAPQMLKYTPGKRCVIAYEFFAGDSSRPRRVIGKVYRKNRGEIIFKHWRQLWQATQGRDMPFGMPEPLAYLPEIGMILQSVVPGRPLADCSAHEDLIGAMPGVAKNLALLHGLTVAVGEKKTLDDHLGKYCHPGAEALKASCPEVAPLVEKILCGLAEGASLVPPSEICPVHGDLNLAQIFIAENRAYFIDFDGLCLAPPALDVGNLLVTLQVRFDSNSEALQKIFLENYKASRSLQMLTGLRTYQAFAYLRRAAICTRAPAAVANWRQQVRQLLEAGCSFLENG